MAERVTYESYQSKTTAELSLLIKQKDQFAIAEIIERLCRRYKSIMLHHKLSPEEFKSAEVAELLYRTDAFVGNTFSDDNFDLLTVQPKNCLKDGQSVQCPDGYNLSLVFRNYIKSNGSISGLLYLELIQNNFGGSAQDYQAVDSILLNSNYNPFQGDGGQISLAKYGYLSVPENYNSQVSINNEDQYITVKVGDSSFLFTLDVIENKISPVQ